MPLLSRGVGSAGVMWRSGFPGASNTGANLPALFTITGSATTAAAVNTALGISTNTLWSWNGTAFTIPANSVIDSLNFHGGFTLTHSNITIQNSNIYGSGGGEITIGDSLAGTTISNCVLTDSGGGSTTIIKLSPSGTATTGTTIQDCTISGGDSGANRSAHLVFDVSGQAAGLQILRCNMFWWRAALSIQSGTVQDCYIHDAGFITGDHSEAAVLDGVANGSSLTFRHNTMLNYLPQTAAIDCSTLSSPSLSPPCQNITIDSNLLGGGDYPLYCGNSNSSGGVPSRAWQITDTACSITGGTTLNDTSLVAGDAGATVTGAGIPAFTTISGVTPGTSATLSRTCTNSGSVDVTFHYSNNIAVTNNTFSTLYYTLSGHFGTHVYFDTTVASNIWTGNKYDTGVVINAGDP